MLVVTSLAQFREALEELRKDKPASWKPGFVPTMGYLHEGHASLMRLAKEEQKTVVLSVFVNPTQFGPQEDFAQYPRNREADTELCKKNGVDLLWFPGVEDLYPEAQAEPTWVETSGPSSVLEGLLRPGHFRGVSTVVCKLLNAVGPSVLYLGQKDAQQVAVLRKTLKDLLMPQEIRVAPIQRASDGLALSSRNTYLSAQERQAALALSRGLKKAKEAWKKGSFEAHDLKKLVQEEIQDQALLQLQYVECVDPESFKILDEACDNTVLCLACFAGKTRLIDNTILGKDQL